MSLIAWLLVVGRMAPDIASRAVNVSRRWQVRPACDQAGGTAEGIYSEDEAPDRPTISDACTST